MIHAFFSNEVEQLYTNLKEELFTSNNSFGCVRRLIIVPSAAMRSWLMLRMADDPDLQIAFGMEIGYLDQTIQKIVSCMDPTLSWSPKPGLELALALEIEIRTLLNSALASEPLWEPLWQYLGVERLSESFSAKTDRRLTAFCDLLSVLFSRYGVYGGKVVKEWERTKSTDWQAELWRRLFDEQRNYPYRLIETLIEKMEQKSSFPRQSIDLHLFALSYLPKLYHVFFSKLSAKLPIHYYMLSPCQAFWSDLKSDRELLHLKQHMRKAGRQTVALEDAYRERNPLLANLGKLGREMAKQLEESDLLSEENYILSEAVCDHAQYNELILLDGPLKPAKKPLTLLQGIQSDLTLMRNLDLFGEGSVDRVCLEESDTSVQLHMAPTQMREVEVLYHALLKIIRETASSEDPIRPADIVVMAPDISIYHPFIKTFFQRSDSLLESEIADIQSAAHNPLICGLRQMLKLIFGRWESSTILHLLDNAPFQRRFGFSQEEAALIKRWVQTVDVRWGYNFTHRDTILQRDQCHSGMLEKSNVGTWEDAIQRLLAGVVLEKTSTTMGIVEHTEKELLGKWISIIRSLKKDIEFLERKEKRNLQEWSHFFKCLLECYFDLNDAAESDPLLGQIDALAEAGEVLSEEKLPLSSILYHLEKQWEKTSEISYQRNLNAVRFCSLLPMRALPAKVIAILGMEEGAYPRRTTLNSLDRLVAEGAKSDYSPTQTEYDRYLFLEALLSARAHFLLFYRGYGASESQEQPPALVVTELFSYLDQAFRLGEKKPSTACTIKHPFLSFDASYFRDNGFKSESFSDYCLAKAHYGTQEKYINSSVLHAHSDEKKIEKIELKKLIECAKNPIKTYVNHTLGVYLHPDEPIKVDEEFQLSSLQKYAIKKEAFSTPLTTVLQTYERMGKLPIGPFKAIAKERLNAEVEQLHINLEALGIDFRALFDIELSSTCSTIEREKNLWKLPSLKIPYRDQIVEVVGIIENVSFQGLVVDYKENFYDLIKVWPKFLVMTHLIQQHQLSIQPKLLLTKERQEKGKAAFYQDSALFLIDFIDYYIKSQKELLPLIPEWIPHLFSKDKIAFGKMVEQALNNPFQKLHNPYLQWIARNGMLFNEEKFEMWKQEATKLYAKMHESWFLNKN